MKILTAAQLRDLDAYTIQHEPISSIDLMERASVAFANKISERWDADTPLKVFAGPGNNGGDALAVSRILAKCGYEVSVYLFNTSGKLSEDCQENLRRVKGLPGVQLEEVTSSFNPPFLGKSDLVIDGLFGTGVTRPLSGGFAAVVKYLNASDATIVSIDVPSGLMCEDNAYNVSNHIIKADYTFTFQFPKLAFFFPENEEYVGDWSVVDIGIKDPENELTSTSYYFTEESDVRGLIRHRSRFAHKGSVGKAALVAGQKGMAGAAILAARACLRSGAGKIVVRTPEYNVMPLQIAVPEAVLSVDPSDSVFSQPFDVSAYDALAIGPGIGDSPVTSQAFIELLSMSKVPVVLDADAINILGRHRGWISQLPKNCILTPHKKELVGLIGTVANSYEGLEESRSLCVRQQIFIDVKGALSAVCCPDGSVYFNPTGNPAMATAGSGDVLTGVVLSLLSQGYSADLALKLGVYIHGLAGDIAAETLGHEGVIASDLVDNVPRAIQKIKQL